MIDPISSKIINWYQQHARDLPWRSTSDPYAIWVSEIMLQQTRVETVIPYFTAWLKQFPDVFALAKAKQQQVLVLWEGLGYYARARNMHRCAQVITAEYDGEFPADYDLLIRLPGIGPYTAAAICSFAFHLDLPAVDANLKRILSRLFQIDSPVNDPKSHRVFYNQAAALLPPGESSAFNQGLMDLGAMVCLPGKPDCANCILQQDCQANAAGTTDEFPKRKAQKQKPHIIVTAAVIQQDGKYLLTQRPQDGLLGGLWEYPGGKQEDGESLEECLKREISEELDVAIETGKELGIYTHSYTHFHVTLYAFECRILNGQIRNIQIQDKAWVLPDELENYPMGKIDRMISENLLAIT